MIKVPPPPPPGLASVFGAYGKEPPTWAEIFEQCQRDRDIKGAKKLSEIRSYLGVRPCGFTSRHPKPSKELTLEAYKAALPAWFERNKDKLND